MDALSRELEALLRQSGADLIGFADLGALAQGDMPFGVCVAVAIPPDVIRSIQSGPSMAYFAAYNQINAKLDRIVSAAAEYLRGEGYRSHAQTATHAAASPDHRTALPHKTVATRAGLGWIGKCALLVTREYGSGIRISSLVTDAPLTCGEPVGQSACGRCDACVDGCPAKAVTGETWRAGMERERLLDVRKCRRTARALAADRIHKEITLCGKCVEVCPFTRRYVLGAGDNL